MHGYTQIVFMQHRCFISLFVASASPADKRQLQAVVASHSVLVAKVQAREVAADVMAKVDGFVAAIASKNFAAANSIQMVSGCCIYCYGRKQYLIYSAFLFLGFGEYVLGSPQGMDQRLQGTDPNGEQEINK